MATAAGLSSVALLRCAIRKHRRANWGAYQPKRERQRRSLVHRLLNIGATRFGTLRDEVHFTQATQAAIWIATTAVETAGKCFALGGGSALFETSTLQRRLRDIHAVVQERHYVGAGKLLLGRGEVARSF